MRQFMKNSLQTLPGIEGVLSKGGSPVTAAALMIMSWKSWGAKLRRSEI